MKHKDILIVEDDRGIALDLLRIAKAAGFSKVKVTFDPHDALRIAQDETVDIVLSDIHLSHTLSGVALAKSLRECCRVVCIFMSADRDDDTLRAVSNVDCAGYVLKPFRDDEIEVALKLAALSLPAKSTLPEPWRYEEGARLLYCEGSVFPLPPKEKLLFHLLYRANGDVVPYANIETLLWPNSAVNDNARRQLIYRLKKRLEGLQIVIEKGQGIALKSEQ